MTERETLRNSFLGNCGWQQATIDPLIPDASFRCYFRLTRADSQSILMDAPPEHEDIESFIKITHHLHRLGIRCPKIYHHDVQHGFVLLEDLGDLTFTHLLQQDKDETELYGQALNILENINSNPEATDIDLPNYDFNMLMEEANLFTQWYLPAVSGHPLAPSVKSAFVDCWNLMYQQLPELRPTLVLRDYHVDNLIMTNQQCAVLDYQDALIGSPAYDLVSLLEDARRDISKSLYSHALSRFLQYNPHLNASDLQRHCAFWGAQRHCKVAGIFTRLWLRDNKPGYLEHLPRVMTLLQRNLQLDEMAPLKNWFNNQGFPTQHHPFGSNREQLLPIPPPM